MRVVSVMWQSSATGDVYAAIPIVALVAIIVLLLMWARDLADL